MLVAPEFGNDSHEEIAKCQPIGVLLAGFWPCACMHAPLAKVRVTLLCKIRGERRHQAAEGIECRMQHPAGAVPFFFVGIEPPLDKLDVIVGEHVPGKLPQSLECTVELACFHRGSHLSHSA